MPVRVLHVVTYMGRGGLETMLMNCYRQIDREKVQFDFLVHRPFRASYDDEIEALGGRIYRLPRLNPVDPNYYRSLKSFFREHPEYNIVHSHLDCMSAIPLNAAKKAGIPVRIAHSHSSNQDKNWKYLLKRYYVKKIPASATHLFACSDAAGKWMFSDKAFSVIKNGVDTKKFAFSHSQRMEIKLKLNLQNAVVLGHVGRFWPVKNHNFLLEVFLKVREKNPNAVLLLAGDGPLLKEVEKQVNHLGIAEYVVFAGLQSDVSAFYQAMDVFVLPSLYEGLPLVLVEAQTAGLPCVVSNRVPGECNITGDLVTMQRLEDSAEQWAEHILSVVDTSRTDRTEQIKAQGYDIQTTADWLQDFYLTRGGLHL